MRDRTTIALLFAMVLASCTGPSTAPSPSSPTDPSVEPTGVSPTPDGIPAGSWKAAGNMVSAHAFHTATLLAEGRVLVAGGLVNDRVDGQVSAFAELFDPGSDAWVPTGAMSEARWGHTATLLRDGKVLVAGSYRNSSDPLATAELYDPRTGRWTATGRMTQGRGGHTASLLPDGRVLVVGGGAEETSLGGNPRSATAELYDPGTGRWTATERMIEARAGFTATLLRDGRVLVAGGDGGYAAAELYDPESGRWTATGSMADGRFGHTATSLPDGRVLVTGGCACSAPDEGALASAELYDPDSGGWTASGSMDTPRFGHTASLLADGTVLVVNDGLHGRLPSAEVYDPGAGRWSVTASPAASRFGYSATPLLDGSVLVTGDYDDSSRAAAELYVPAGDG